MKRKGTRGQAPAETRPAGLTVAKLEAMIQEATPDCEGDAEMVSGLFLMIEEEIAYPFKATAHGRTVTVEGVETTARDVIVALCRKSEDVEEIPILELRLPTPRPAGTEWIEAYRHWVKHGF